MMHKPQNTSMVFRYNTLLFSAILVLAAALSMLFLNFAADRFERYEVKNMEKAMRLAADDLENQYEILEDIARQIQITSFYQPNVVRLSATREIELLKYFVYFKNYSPIVDTYFLIYPDLFPERMKVFTSDGKTSYFRYYGASVFGVNAEEAEKIYEVIAQARDNTVFTVKEKAVFVFPMRFVETQLPDSRAVAAFVIPIKTLEKRMYETAAGLPDHTVCILNGLKIGSEGTGEESVSIQVSSEKQTSTACAFVKTDKWQILRSSIPAWMFAGFAVCLFLVSAVSIMISGKISKPLKNLIHRYAPPGERIRNEFIQLEEMILHMEQENGNSMKQLRQKTILTILHGYYSEGLMNRWGFLHLDFNKRFFRVSVLNAMDLTETEAEAYAEELEKTKYEDVHMFSVFSPEDHVISVICAFDSETDEERVRENICAFAKTRNMDYCTGGIYDTPEKLPVSYMEALTAFLRTKKWKEENLADDGNFVLQLVTAAERGDYEGMKHLTNEFSEQIKNVYVSGSQVRNMAAQLVAELGVLAGERHVELDPQRAGMLMLLTGMSTLLEEVTALVKDIFSKDDGKVMSRADQTAQAVVEYVQENAYDPDFNLGRIADSFGLSNDYASAMIKKHTGMAFKEYLTELRLLRAERLLRTRHEFTVNDISTLVGYRKTSNFIKKFREKYGCTPAQYR